MAEKSLFHPLTAQFAKERYFQILLLLDVPILLHAGPAQWLQVDTINKAKHAVFSLLHARTLQSAPDIAQKYRIDAFTYYQSAITQLQWRQQGSWGTIVFHHCAVYFCIYEAITGNKEAAETHMSFLLDSGERDARRFLCSIMRLLPQKWKCYNFRIDNSSPPLNDRWRDNNKMDAERQCTATREEPLSDDLEAAGYE